MLSPVIAQAIGYPFWEDSTGASGGGTCLVDENGDMLVDENGDCLTYANPPVLANWWSDGVAADAYGGEFESALDTSFLVIDGVYSHEGGYDRWESLQNSSNYLSVGAGTSSLASGATEIVQDTYSANGWVGDDHAGLDGGAGADEIFMIWAGMVAPGFNYSTQHNGDGTNFSLIDMNYGLNENIDLGRSTAAFQNAKMGSFSGGSIHDPASADVVCAAVWANQTRVKLWFNGVLYVDAPHGLTFELGEGQYTRTSIGTGLAAGAVGWGYNEPSNVPAMMKAVTKYWQDGVRHIP